jgi:hypothetical protein
MGSGSWERLVREWVFAQAVVRSDRAERRYGNFRLAACGGLGEASRDHEQAREEKPVGRGEKRLFGKFCEPLSPPRHPLGALGFDARDDLMGERNEVAGWRLFVPFDRQQIQELLVVLRRRVHGYFR